MSEDHDYSDNVEFEESEVAPDNEQIGGKKEGAGRAKKKRPPVHPSFRAPGPPNDLGWGFILGFVAGSTVHWSIPDLAAMFNVAQTTLYEGLARQPGGVTSADYVSALKDHFLPAFRRHQQRDPSTKFLLIQDGCRIHTTDEALEAIRSWGLEALNRKEWPPHSPDLNVIENLWGFAKHAVNKELAGDLSASAAAKQNLESGILEMWRGHPQPLVNKLVASFLRRLREVVRLKGKYTKY